MAVRRSVSLGILIGLVFLASCTFSNTADVPCSTADLIAAIDSANISTATTNTINLEANCVYVLGDLTHSDDGISVLPTITTPIVINGNAATLQLQKTGLTPPSLRMFNIDVNGDLSLNSMQLESVNNVMGNIGRDEVELGGAIINHGALALDDVTFYNNFANQGGAIFNTGALTAQSSTFEANSAQSGGGAIISDGTVSLTNTTFLQNNTWDRNYGGAISQTGGSLTVTDSVFEGNRASGYNAGMLGGGAIGQIGGSLTVTGSIFNSNIHSYSWGSLLQGYPRNIGGGAIFMMNVSFTVEESFFENNTTNYQGGAISYSSEGWIFDTMADPNYMSGFINSAEGSGNPGIATVSNCEFTGNEGTTGAAIYHEHGTVNITYSEFNGNLSNTGGTTLSASGGGALIIQSSLFANNSTSSASVSTNYGINGYIDNSTFSNNTGSVFVRGDMTIVSSTITDTNGSAPGLVFDPVGPDAALLELGVEYLIVANNGGGDCDIQGSFNAAGQNLDSDGSCPGFTITDNPLLVPLADNGGPTMTHALMVGSPALGSAAGSCLNTDQRMVSRPPSGCDLGAYEDTTLLSNLPEIDTERLDPSIDQEPANPGRNRCDLFEGLEIAVTMLDIAPGSTFQTIYLTIPGGVPGLEVEVAEDPGPWQYRAALGSAEAEECTFEGYAERLYCNFELSTAALGTVQELFAYVNDCPDPFFHHPRVSIFEPAPVCTAELPESECIAVGGEFVHVTDTLDMCDCP